MSTHAFPAEAVSAILAWYDGQGRRLPFRGTTDPYAILVSEVMAQQTQIHRVGPKWLAFLATFPSFEMLAAATPADVLRSWAGLGYNRRALNLWRCAREVVEKHGGRLPSDLAALTALPGIGPYTARAVAAIAFAAPVGPVDTNVRRVIGRATGAPTADVQLIADAIVPPERPADWTHAVMDVGATFCRTSGPRCGECPAKPWCRYAAEPREQARPIRPGGQVPFHRTSRWLRGRILERARSADGWVTFDSGIGEHGVEAVRAAVRVLASEGMLEMDIGTTSLKVRLATS